MSKLIHLFLLAVLFSVGSVFAQKAVVVDSELVLAALSKDAAAEIVREKQGGRILEIKRYKKGKRPIYVIKILTNEDRIKKYRVDVETGAILGN